ncbi:Cbr3 [Symbiodinium natans]|uniref:Cbr3 protein n=1 Tax=Symbiodinium natans TaxID=878477 RepID=A0A812KZL3_9DINO|nr:Cbr3 [Symbiodinium natans]
MASALVTGGNQGIGFHTARLLIASRKYSRVLIACRREAAGRDAAKELGCEFVHLDVGDATSVSSLPARLQTSGVSRLNLLVNNAGVMYDGWSRENWERHWSTNVAGQVELFNALKSHLDTRACVVNVSSGWGCKSEMQNVAIADKVWACDSVEELLDFGSKVFGECKQSGWFEFYKISKCFLNRWTVLLHEKDPDLKALGASVYAVCPGWCHTSMGDRAGGIPSRSAEEGAQSVVAAALGKVPAGSLSRDGEQVGGKGIW